MQETIFIVAFVNVSTNYGIYKGILQVVNLLILT